METHEAFLNVRTVWWGRVCLIRYAMDKTVLNNEWAEATVQEEMDPISSFSFCLF